MLMKLNSFTLKASRIFPVKFWINFFLYVGREQEGKRHVWANPFGSGSDVYYIAMRCRAFGLGLFT